MSRHLLRHRAAALRTPSLGDGFGLVVAAEVPGRLGEGAVGAATDDDPTFVLGHGGNDGAGVVRKGVTGHASADGHHHVDDEVRIVVEDGA